MDAEQLEHVYIVGRDGKWYNHFRKQFGNFLKNELPCDPATTRLDIFSEDMKLIHPHLEVYAMFIAALVRVAKICKSKYPSKGTSKLKPYSHTMGDYSGRYIAFLTRYLGL